VLTGVDFRVTCLVSAAIFALLSVVQIRALPARRPEDAKRQDGDAGQGVLAQWRGILANRPFLLFSVAMIGSYVLSFQVYLALPLEVRRLGGDGESGTAAVAMLFAVSGLTTILGQTRVTAWCKERYEPGRALVRGLAAMGLAFVPLLLATAVPAPESGIGLWLLAAVPPMLAALLLAIGTMIAYPFEMDTIVRLSGDRLVATHYGLYNTICGVGITVGNLGTGAALDAARAAGMPALPWIALTVLGLACAAALYGLHRTGRLAAQPASERLAAAV
jgi:Na+/melibiose symporter-like transporter